jgi:hypothetical protein
MIGADKPETHHDCEWPNCQRSAYAHVGQRWYCGEHALRAESLTRDLISSSKRMDVEEE